MDFPILETNRLMLRSISSCDIDAIYSCWMKDKDVSKYMWWEASADIKRTQQFVLQELEHIGNKEWIRWIIVEKESKNIIGTCLLYFNDETNHYDISYNLGKAYWGFGYITEAMKEVFVYAKSILKIEEIYTSYAIENKASARVLEKFGFESVKTIDYECNGGKCILPGMLVKCRL